MAREVVLGIDGGGTKTTCVVMGIGSKIVLGRSVGTSSNRNSVGMSQAVETIISTAKDALAIAGLHWEDVDCVCACISGVDTPNQQNQVAQELQKRFDQQTRVGVHNDAVAALASGTGGEVLGCVLIAGTGTIAFGVSEDGTIARAAGWGANFLDGGSGYDLGQQALAAVAKHIDGRGPATDLTSAFGSHCRYRDGLFGWAYADSGWDRVAELAPLVIQCSQAGDEVATKILDRAVKELASSVRAVAKECKFKEGFQLVLQGGLLREDSPYTDRLKEALAKLTPAPSCVHPQVDAAVAAGWLACSGICG